MTRGEKKKFESSFLLLVNQHDIISSSIMTRTNSIKSAMKKTFLKGITSLPANKHQEFILKRLDTTEGTYWTDQFALTQVGFVFLSDEMRDFLTDEEKSLTAAQYALAYGVYAAGVEDYHKTKNEAFNRSLQSFIKNAAYAIELGINDKQRKDAFVELSVMLKARHKALTNESDNQDDPQ